MLIRIAVGAVGNDGPYRDQLGKVQSDLSEGAAFLTTCLELLRDPYRLYQGANDKVRRRLNQAIFKRLCVFEDKVTGHEFQLVIAELHAIEAGRAALRRGEDEATAMAVADGVLDSICRKRRLPPGRVANV